MLRRQKHVVDKNILVTAISLTVFGLIAVADASAPQALNVFNDRFYFVKQQAIWALVGIIGMVILSKIPYMLWEKVAAPAFFLSLLLLIAVLIPGIGSTALGARRWIYLGFFSVQPSEIIKFSLSLYFAKLASNNKSRLLSFVIPLGVISLLVMIQPDLGTTLIINSIGLTQIFVSGVNIFHFLGIIVGGAGLSVLAIMTSAYRRARLLTFFAQTQDPLGRSYHIRQILLSLGLGGVFGVGIGASRQKFLFLPESATDSIFAVIAEEIGFVGATILIFVLLYFVYKLINVARFAPDKFSKVLSTGLASWIFFQIFLNIGSILAIVPLTGVPLPFISYGGSALTMTLCATGILLNISSYADTPKKKKR